MIRFRPLPILSAFTALVFALLLVLGHWQWDRFTSKLHRSETPPAALNLPDFTPIPSAAAFVFGVMDGRAGWRVFTPVRQSSGEVTFVDCAFLPGAETPDPQTAKAVFARGRAAIAGVRITPGRASGFAPPPDLAHRLFYHIDLKAMGQAVGVDPVTTYYVAIPYLGPDGRTIANPFADPDRSDALPPEQHFSYALTWWGLAAGLLVVYAALHIRSGRLSFRRTKA